MPCLRMSVNRLREGMIIREDVFSKTGAVIVPDGAVVTKDVVALLTRHFVDSVMVEYPTGRKERPEQQEQHPLPAMRRIPLQAVLLRPERQERAGPAGLGGLRQRRRRLPPQRQGRLRKEPTPLQV